MKQQRAVFTKLEFDSVSERLLTCSFTGYRPSKLPFGYNTECEEYKKLYEALKNEICLLIDNGVTYFQTGMAQGVDLMCGKIVLELKEIFDIHLFCVIPCENQCQGWSDEDIKLYQRLLRFSSGVTYTSDSEYTKGCMMKRNRYLVDNAEYILAVFDGQKGGTMSTIEYAKKKHRSIIIINPNDYTKVELFHSGDEGVSYV